MGKNTQESVTPAGNGTPRFGQGREARTPRCAFLQKGTGRTRTSDCLNANERKASQGNTGRRGSGPHTGLTSERFFLAAHTKYWRATQGRAQVGARVPIGLTSARFLAASAEVSVIQTTPSSPASSSSSSSSSCGPPKHSQAMRGALWRHTPRKLWPWPLAPADKDTPRSLAAPLLDNGPEKMEKTSLLAHRVIGTLGLALLSALLALSLLLLLPARR